MYQLPSNVLLDTLTLNGIYTKSKNYIFLTKPYISKDAFQLHDETIIYTSKYIKHVTLNYKQNSNELLERITILNFNMPYLIEFQNNNDISTSFTVELFECKTVLGNIMILFKDSKKRNILYTGSIAIISENNLLLPNIKRSLNGERLHSLLFDDTFRKCSHPNSISKTCSEISNLLKQYPKFTVILGLPALDYEEILLELTIKYGISIYINQNSLRYFLLKHLQLDQYFCSDKESAKIIVKTEIALPIDVIESLFKNENKLTIKFVKFTKISTYEKFKEYNKLGLFQFNYFPHSTDECRRHILDALRPKFIDSMMTFTSCSLVEQNDDNLLNTEDSNIFKLPIGNKVPKSKIKNDLCQTLTNCNTTSDDISLPKRMVKTHRKVVTFNCENIKPEREHKHRPVVKTAKRTGQVKYLNKNNFLDSNVSDISTSSTLKSPIKTPTSNSENIEQMEQEQEEKHPESITANTGKVKYLKKNNYLDSTTVNGSEVDKSPTRKSPRKRLKSNADNIEQMEQEQEERLPERMLTANLGKVKYLKKNNFLDSTTVNGSEVDKSPTRKSPRKRLKSNSENIEQMEQEQEEPLPERILTAKTGKVKYLKKNNYLDSTIFNGSDIDKSPTRKSPRKRLKSNSDNIKQLEQEQEEPLPEHTLTAKMGKVKYLKKNNFLDSPVNVNAESSLVKKIVRSRKTIDKLNKFLDMNELISESFEQREKTREQLSFKCLPESIKANMGKVKYLNKNKFLD